MFVALSRQQAEFVNNLGMDIKLQQQQWLRGHKSYLYLWWRHIKWSFIMGENGGTFEPQRLDGVVGADCAGISSTCRPRGRCRRRSWRRRWRSINQCTAAIVAAVEAAAMSMSMALAANMKYHTAKPFFMNIKFRLTISISCTNVSVTKFALGLGQPARREEQADRQSSSQAVKQSGSQ